MGDDGKWFDRNCWRNKGRAYRYFAMLNFCLLGLGAFVCFDTVGALQEALMTRFDINFSEFSLMYTVHSLPNIVLSLFGGVLIDRVFGIKIGTLIYACIFTFGYMIFSLGVLLQTYWCALLGRFLSGAGAEMLYICVQIYSIHYFKGKELSMVMCINISVGRLGSAVVYAIAEPILSDIRKIAGEEDVGITLYIIGSFTILTVSSSFLLTRMNPKNDEQMSVKNKNNKAPKISWRDFIMYPLEFWLCVTIYIAFTVSIYVFLPYTQEFFKTIYNMSVESANAVTSYFSIIGAVIAPFTGIIIDRLGRSVFFAQIAALAAMVAHVILGWSDWTPYFSLFILSISYALFNGSVVPMFAFIIPEHKLGTAYGLSLALTNAGYALTMFIAGVIVDEYSYTGLEVFTLSFTGVGILATIALWIKDKRATGILNMTPQQRKSLTEKQEKEADEAKSPLNRE